MLFKSDQSMVESYWLQGTISPALPNYHVQVPVALENPQAKTGKCQQVKCTPACQKKESKQNKKRGVGKEKREYEQNATASMLLQLLGILY